MARTPLTACAIALALLSPLRTARADPPVMVPVDTKAGEPASRRYELAGFPILGGNSDIGVQFGGAATLTRFDGDAVPYLWNLDLVLSASAKGGDDGLRLVQQSHLIRLDAPWLFDGHFRLDSRVNYQRTIDEGYFGIGNAARDRPAPGTPFDDRRYEYLQDEGRLRVIGRVHTASPIDFAFGTIVRYEAPNAYPGSQLEADARGLAAEGVVRARGLDPGALATVSAGLMVDTRDSEFVTTRGLFYQLGAGATKGTMDGIGYAEASAVLSHYLALGGPFVLAGRVVASFQAGKVPFYDLEQGGVFEPQYMFGGETGVRGVPHGRYAGKVKALGNLELRTLFPRFELLAQRFRFGATTFVDAGRVWAGYDRNPAADGTGPGVKFGVGGGVFIQWGEAAIFRIEAAYSPDAAAVSPDFPVGFYVSDGLMF